MPDLIGQLETISHDLAWLAIAWHAVLLVVGIAFVAGWRPRVPIATLVFPAASVAVVSLAYGNPFNAVSFGVLAVLLGTLANRSTGVGPRAQIGAALVVFAWAYPHFVDGWHALYAAPVGVIPCPTLALIAGVVLIANGTRAISAVLAVWTAFYALFGVIALGVTIDVALVAAAIALAAQAMRGNALPFLRGASRSGHA